MSSTFPDEKWKDFTANEYRQMLVVSVRSNSSLSNVFLLDTSISQFHPETEKRSGKSCLAKSLSDRIDKVTRNLFWFS